jgi:hypothetical protein
LPFAAVNLSGPRIGSPVLNLAFTMRNAPHLSEKTCTDAFPSKRPR